MTEITTQIQTERKTVNLDRLLKKIKGNLGNKEYRIATAMKPHEKLALLSRYYAEEQLYVGNKDTEVNAVSETT